MSRFPVLLITGVSCTGKTKLKEELEPFDDQSRFFLCEVDDNDRPEIHTLEEALEWTHGVVRGFFKKASESRNEDPPQIPGITGIIYPERVGMFTSDFPNLEPVYCLLEIDDETLRERLKVKFEKNPSEVEPYFNLNKEQMESLRRQVKATPIHLILNATKPPEELAATFKEELLGLDLSE